MKNAKYLSSLGGAILILLTPFLGFAADLVDGYVVVNPVGARSCIAVRVEVAASQALAGLRWFNGTTSHSFSKVLVASGSEDVPPAYDQAVVLAESPTGTEDSWSELEFSEPVASLSGTLFVILQYPPNYVPVEGCSPLGVGYQDQTSTGGYFVSSDGDSWLKVADQCKILLEPIYTARDPNAMAKGAIRDGGEKPEATAIPTAFALGVHPNPFNPETQLELSLPQDEHVTIKVYDLRGRLIRNLFSGEIQAGTATFHWDGRDEQGTPTSSGVYWARAEAGEKTLTNRMVLVK